MTADPENPLDVAAAGVRTRPIRLALFLSFQLALLLATLEFSLRLLKPHHGGLRALLYRSATATDYSDAATLPELMGRTANGFTPLEARHGFVLNSRSFRTAEYPLEKPEGTFRVVALGDSFTYGVVPDEDRWTTVVASALAGASGRDVEVLNLGVPGTGVPFQLRLWQVEGARLGADLVILGLFVGNDFFDELGMAPGWRGTREKLVTVSYTYRVLRNLLRLRRGVGRDPLPERGRAPTGAGVYREGGFELEEFRRDFDDRRPTFTPEAYRAIEAERMSICLKEERMKFDFRFDRVARLVERLDWEVRETGARLTVLIIPDEFQVDAGVRAEAVLAAGKSASDYDFELPQARLKEFFRDRGIDHLDLLPAFRKQGSEEPLYLPRDSHWNRAGNRLAARALVRHLGAGRASMK